jgi:hypothetical protein
MNKKKLSNNELVNLRACAESLRLKEEDINNQEKEIKIVTIQMSSEAYEQLNELKEQDKFTLVEIFRNAIKLYHYIRLVEKDECKFFIQEKSSKKMKEIILF